MKSAVPPPLESAPTLAETEAVFDALAHEVRRHILQLLSQRGGELPSGYLAQKFAHSWPTTTRHLRVLEAAGLVEVRREGRSSFYRLDRDRLRRIAGGWLALLDPPDPGDDLAVLRISHRQERHPTMTATQAAKLFRVTIEVSDLEKATALYSDLLGTPGKRHPGARHYYDCGGVILAVLDVSRGGVPPTAGPKSMYFAVEDVAAVHARAKKLGVLAPYQVHGQPAAEVITRPWGEKSFYVVDPWGNDLCFCEDGTLYT